MFRKKKYLIGGIIILAVLGYLGFTAFQNSATYYYTVDELLTGESISVQENVKVQGKVVVGSVTEDSSTHDVHFTIAHDNYSLPVIYNGVIPDAFKEDNDVVVEGYLEQEGIFQAHTISVKCPSKYVAEE